MTTRLCALLLFGCCAVFAQDQQSKQKAASTISTQDSVSQTVSPSMSGGAKAEAAVPQAAQPETDSKDSLVVEEKDKLKNKKTPVLGSSTYPLPAPVAATVYIKPGAEEDGITLTPGSQGFQLRNVFRSREVSGVKVSVEIFCDYSYFDDEPRIACKGSYATERHGKTETMEFERTNTFLKFDKPLLLHQKDGKSISVSVSKVLPVK
ncbi:MAG TPA: hypothetical protein PLL10_05025 [Elusimicrobiales bacterium]|nr:hypothetical protein [Elusimicrobiales bacterium]